MNLPAVPSTLPVIPLRSTMVFPTSVLGLQIGVPENLATLEEHDGPFLAALVVAPGAPDDPVDPKALCKIGVMARLVDRLNLPGGTMQVTVHGLRRVRLSDVTRENGFVGRAKAVKERQPDDDTAADLSGRILTSLEALAGHIDRISKEIPAILRMNLADPGRFADLVATLGNFSVASKDDVVQTLDVERRLEYVLGELEEQIGKASRAQEDGAGVPEGETAEGRAERLRHRIRVLQAELGNVDPTEKQAVDLLKKVEAAELPPDVANRARLEVERLRSAGAGSPEADEIRSYLEWVMALPWSYDAAPPPDRIDLARVRRTLDKALLGLDEPKDRLLDYVSVSKLRGDLKGPIPCIVGPPEVGKTTLARALAKGLGREVCSIELGGKSEPYLVGERRTRASAKPGRIVTCLRDAGSRDLVILLEELDLLGAGNVDGDPVAALEQIVSWDSRADFVDRYLDLPFDLSHVLFLATARDFSRVPADLRDHVVEVRLAGYTPEEKVDVAKKKLLPELIAENGIEKGDVAFPDDTLYFLARGYARDSGFGLMRRELSTLLRTRARARAQGEEGRWTFDKDRVVSILGNPRYTATVAESAPEVGVVTGLAWTASGGEIMFIEALRMPGSGRLLITGSLGDVMRESVNAAYSYARSRAVELGIDPDAFRSYDLHVHFPEGAVPKDGPSAGVAVTLAIASTLSDRPVRHDIAMTGEVTLRGKVLEVGGIKEKVLAAYRAGLRHVILPAGNERDLRDVPEEARKKMRFTFVERVDDVFDVALVPQDEKVVAEKADAWRRERQRRPQTEREVASPGGSEHATSPKNGGDAPGKRPGRAPGRKPGERPGE